MLPRPRLSYRLLDALAIGAVGGALMLVGHAPDRVARVSDWSFAYLAARGVLHGASAYLTVDRAVAVNALTMPYFYPGTATTLALPFAPLPFNVAVALWSAGSLGLLAYAFGREPWRLLGLLSAPVAVAYLHNQWSPLLTAATALPWLGFVWAAKPNLGLALFAGWPSRAAAIGVVALVALSLLIAPSWPLEWRQVLAFSPHYLAPVRRPLGWVLLLAWLRWREPEGRMLGMLALIPHTANAYELVPLLLIPRTPRQLLLVIALGWCAMGLTIWPPRTMEPEVFRTVSWQAMNWPTYLALWYLPALAILFWSTRVRPRTDAPGSA